MERFHPSRTPRKRQLREFVCFHRRATIRAKTIGARASVASTQAIPSMHRQPRISRNRRAVEGVRNITVSSSYQPLYNESVYLTKLTALSPLVARIAGVSSLLWTSGRPTSFMVLARWFASRSRWVSRCGHRYVGARSLVGCGLSCANPVPLWSVTTLPRRTSCLRRARQTNCDDRHPSKVRSEGCLSDDGVVRRQPRGTTQVATPL